MCSNRSMWELWQRELIAEARHAILGTIGADGRPHVVPVCYAEDGGAFVIAVDEKPKTGAKLARIRHIERDARVSLLIERYDDDWSRLAWLRIDGEAAMMTGGDRPGALAALRGRYPQYQGMRLEGLPLIVITPGRVAAWRWPEAAF